MANKRKWRDSVPGAVILSAALFSFPAFSAEFILGPAAESAPPSRGSASSLRDKARIQRDAGEPAVPLSTIVKELDDPDSPFGGRPGAAATENRNRARAYQQDGDTKSTATNTPSSNLGVPGDIDRLMIDPDSNRGRVKSNLDRAKAYQQGGDTKSAIVIAPGGNQGVPVDIDRLLIDPDSNRGRLKSNLDRAKAYQRGDSPGVTNARMGGREDLPTVDCGAVQNSAGRIGNDSASGQVVVIMKGEHGVKVRCR